MLNDVGMVTRALVRRNERAVGPAFAEHTDDRYDRCIPATVHLEGTQMSEGRGTTKPFEFAGAPYINADDFAAALAEFEFPGVYFRACGFMPTFQKHAGQACGGIQIHVTDRETFEPTIAGIAIAKTAFDMYGDHFRWKDPPYEYEYDRNPFDLISGTSKVREAIERGDSLDAIQASWEKPLEAIQAAARAVSSLLIG